jgi:hypothetical protein
VEAKRLLQLTLVMIQILFDVPCEFIFNLFEKESNKETRRQVDWRLLPLLGLLYSIDVIDRTNLAMARTAGMNKDLVSNSNFLFIPGRIIDVHNSGNEHRLKVQHHHNDIFPSLYFVVSHFQYKIYWQSLDVIVLQPSPREHRSTIHWCPHVSHNLSRGVGYLPNRDGLCDLVAHALSLSCAVGDVGG